MKRVNDVPEGNWAWVARTADNGVVGLEQRLLRHLRETLAPQGIREIVTFGYRGWEAAYLSELGFHPRLRTITALTLSAAAGELFR